MRRIPVRRACANIILVLLSITATAWPVPVSTAAQPSAKTFSAVALPEGENGVSAVHDTVDESVALRQSAAQATEPIQPDEPILSALSPKPGGRYASARNILVEGGSRVVHGEIDPTSTEQFSYIIQFQDAPLATYRGERPGLAATSPTATGARTLDVRTPASLAYRAWLTGQRMDFRQRAEAALGRPLTVLHQFDTVFNGFSLLLAPGEAQRLLALDGVRSVQRDSLRFATTDDSPAYLGMPGIWDGSATGGLPDPLPGTKGEGVIIGVIDTGVWPEHPSFADDGSFPAPPDKWQGACVQPQDNSQVYLCNNKLIGMRYFLNTYSSLGGYDGLFFSARDDNGHGTHTASTAAGNENVPVSLYNMDRGTISGMAPRAHVAIYKGLGPRGGYTSDLVAAIEAAVADGVDVINYSVGGSSSDPWFDADAQAYLAARAAGVFVVTSAGNGGPGESSIGSPANAPWVMAAGASYFNRLYLSNVAVSGGSVEVPTLTGATSTAGVTDFRLVSAEAVNNVNGERKVVCDAPFAPGTFQATDAVLCQRVSEIATWAMGDFVAAGGAGAAVLYNGEESYDLNTYLYALPAVNLLHEDGVLLQEALSGAAGEVRISFTQGEKAYAPELPIAADTVAGFSARGPAIETRPLDILNVLKPDLVAPGVHVLAGASPQHVTNVQGAIAPYGGQGELFQLIQGTSMSSPHVAGAGALLRALHPDWSPAEIGSALMTTAQSSMQVPGQDGSQATTPFDSGAGRIQPALAAQAALLLDESPGAFADADPAAGGAPSRLNLPALTDAYCVGTCRWTRTVRSSASVPVEWSAATTLPERLVVQPARFTLQPGQAQVLTLSANVKGQRINDWLYGQVNLTPDADTGADSDVSLPEAHLPVAVRVFPGRLPEELTVETRRDAAIYTLEDLTTVSVAELEVNAYAAWPDSTIATLAGDPTPGDSYDFEMGGLFSRTVEIPVDAKRFVIQTGDSSSSDLDLYVGQDLNGDGIPQADEELCVSTSSTAEEFCDLPAVGQTLTPGSYWVVVQNWSGSQTQQDSFTLSVLVVDESDTELIMGDGPDSTQFDTPYDVTLAWDFADFAPGEQLFGALELVDAATDSVLGSMRLTLLRLEDDVQLTRMGDESIRPGDRVSYTLNVQLEPTVIGDVARYTLTDTLPPGLTYVANSATTVPDRIEEGEDGQQLVWEVDLPTTPSYQVTSNATDPLCDTGYGGYVRLADFGITPQAAIVGNAKMFRFDDYFMSAEPVTFYGQSYSNGMYFTDDGFATFLADTGTTPGAHQNLPDPAAPNALLAPFWRDLAVVYDPPAGRGVRVAGTESGLMLLEYAGVEPAPIGSTNDRYTFELIMSRSVREAPGAYEIVFAYSDMNGPFSAYTTGVENEDGTVATQYAHNNIDIEPGLILCFDWDISEIHIEYEVEVDPDVPVPSSLRREIEHTIDAPGYRPEVSGGTLEVPAWLLETTMTGPSVVLPGDPIHYTLTITNNGPGETPPLVAEIPLPVATELITPGTVISGVITFDAGIVPADSVRQVDFAVRPLGPDATTAVAHVLAQAAVVQSQAGSASASNSPEIVGGVEAEPGAWPWQVAIMDARRSNGYEAQFCGGTLLASNWVLTAAHCVADRQGVPEDPARIDVAVGRHTLSSNDGDRIPVSQIIIHPEFDHRDSGIESDVALLRLAQPVETSETVAPISLLSPALTELAVPDTVGVITGWGARTDPDDGPPNYADSLHQATVPVVANDICTQRYDSLYLEDGVITDNMLCAGFAAGGKDSCLGDSGGPLVVPDGNNGWLQAGVVSWGEGCGQPGFYGVYARVSSFYDWLTGAGRNTYTTSGPYRVLTPEGQEVQGFAQIETVVDVGLSVVDLPSVVVGPAAGNVLTTTIDGVEVVLRIPDGAVAQTLIVGLESSADPNVPTGLNTVGTPFALRVFDRTGAPIEGYEFLMTAEMMVRLSGGATGEGNPPGIELHIFESSEAQWMPLPGTFNENRTALTVPVERAGTYALFFDSRNSLLENEVYLPFVGK